MTDLGAVAVAVAAVVGAMLAQPAPRAAAVVAVALAFMLRRPALLVLATAALVSSLAASSWEGLRPPPDGEVRGIATLVTDPVDAGGAVRAELTLGGRHYDTWARGEPASSLRARQAGERVAVEGRRARLESPWDRRLAHRHVVGRLTLTAVGLHDRGSLGRRAVNGLRDLLLNGVAGLPPRDRALYAGFVLGDDSGPDDATVDDFRSSGLTHLLVVSGQNVAFVLALASPLIRRGPLSWRLATGLAVLVLFGTLTRWEPSVLRAEAMAALAMAATVLARPLSPVRLIALAVAALLVIDPLLVHSLGFRLSVGASVGIAALAVPLARSLPGPRPLADAIGVTVGAQAGVAPFLVVAFGGLPVVSLAANLLAVPAAGPVMVWGVLAGLPAGLLGGPAGRVLHLPTQLLITWVATVARLASSIPVGRVGVPHLVVLVAAGLLITRRRRPARWMGAALAASALCAPGLALRSPPAVEEVGPGTALVRQGRATILVTGGAMDGRALLGSLRTRGIGELDVLVLTRAGRRSAAAVLPVLARVGVGAVLAPPRTPVPGARTPAQPVDLVLGPSTVHVIPLGARLGVEVRGPPR